MEARFALPTMPNCFGTSYDGATNECQACIAAYACYNKTMSFGGTLKSDPQQLPTNKKLLILFVCKKFGISTCYVHNDTEYEVTEDNIDEYTSVDFLLTSKDAVKQLALFERVKE